MELAVDGQRIEGAWFGEAESRGPVLVLLHEGLGSVSIWRDWPEKLARATGRRVFAFSRFGYGRSSPVPVPRPLTYMHEEGEHVLPRVLDAAGIEDAVLVGHSDGGSIALIAAGTGESRVTGLVLLAPHVFCEELSVRSIEKAREEFLHGELRARLERHHGENTDCAFWGWNRAWLDPEFRKWNIEEFLPRVRVPVLVIQGEDDPYGTLAQVDAIERGVRGPFQRLVLSDCGHTPQRDQADATTTAIAEFVKTL